MVFWWIFHGFSGEEKTGRIYKRKSVIFLTKTEKTIEITRGIC
jgi:hypothetical protein